MEKIKALIKKFCTKEVILYVIFGVLTTIINLVVTYVLNHFFSINGALSSAIGIISAILVAYFTNRKMVFNSQAKGFKLVWSKYCASSVGVSLSTLVILYLPNY